MSELIPTVKAKLEQLARERIAAKKCEDIAVQMRRSIDAQIVATYKAAGLLKPEGAHSEKIDGVAKITADQEIKRTVADEDLLKKAWQSMTAAQMACFRWKPEVAVQNFKKLQELNPAEFAMIAPFVESKPANVSVKVEILE